jgi:hypothetical protein
MMYLLLLSIAANMTADPISCGFMLRRLAMERFTRFAGFRAKYELAGLYVPVGADDEVASDSTFSVLKMTCVCA